MNQVIGFIGLGKLGLPIASNLLDEGYALRVYNRTANKAEPLVARGAYLAESPADVVTAGGVVASIVWDDAALENVVQSPGFLERLGPGGVHIAMATVLPETSKRIAALHAEYGVAYIDAPIFGRPEAAVARGLWLPIAGSQAAKERVQPILKAMGAQGIFDFGDAVGAASLVKLIGNFLIISAGRSMAEALSVAKANDVDPGAVIGMLTQTLFPAPIYQSYGKRIAQGGTAFESAIPLKDVGLLQATARQLDKATPIADLLHELLQGS